MGPLRRAVHGLSTRLYGPLPSLRGFDWIGDERIAIGALPTGVAVRAIVEAKITHIVNTRARLQTVISQDLWVERALLGPSRVAHAPMWDHGRPQPPELWARAALFAAAALEEDPSHRVLVHCQQGRRRSVMVTYAVLRLRGHAPDAAAELIARHRKPARLIPTYQASVEAWLAERGSAEAVR
jgi:hypothetical protein